MGFCHKDTKIQKERWLCPLGNKDPRWSDEDAEEHEEKKQAEEGDCHLGKMLKLIMVLMRVMSKMILFPNLKFPSKTFC